MRVILNSEEKNFADGLTVHGLLETLNLTGQYVAVERNREIVPYQEFTNTVLCEDDVLEIVTLVGGG